MGKKKKRKPIHNFLKSNRKEVRILRFIILFNLFAIPLYAILFSGAHLYELQKFTADAVYGLLGASGFSPAIHDLFVYIPIKDGVWGAFIDWDCVGWKSMLAFFALVFATDFSLRKKLWGMIFIPVIYVVNIGRIWYMFYYVRTYDLANYAVVHQFVWSWGLIITILVLWYIWIRYFDEKRLPRLF